jgi:hypothetical protein
MLYIHLFHISYVSNVDDLLFSVIYLFKNKQKIVCHLFMKRETKERIKKHPRFDYCSLEKKTIT